MSKTNRFMLASHQSKICCRQLRYLFMHDLVDRKQFVLKKRRLIEACIVSNSWSLLFMWEEV